MSYHNGKFPFEKDIKDRFTRWLGVDDAEVLESLEDLCGDTYFEMRKLIAVMLSEVEEMIRSEKYSGYKNGEELSEEDRGRIKEIKEDFKEFARTSIETTWRSILNKQKVGIDKLGLALRPYLHQNDGQVK